MLQAFWQNEAAARCQSLLKTQRQCEQLARQVIAVPSLATVTHQDGCVSAGSSLSARSCTTRQQPKLKVFWLRGVWTALHR